jgi:hypothetical protein
VNIIFELFVDVFMNSEAGPELDGVYGTQNGLACQSNSGGGNSGVLEVGQTRDRHGVPCVSCRRHPAPLLIRARAHAAPSSGRKRGWQVSAHFSVYFKRRRRG